TIRPDQDRATKREFAFLICQTNISEHNITLDNSTFDYEFRLLDSRGIPVPFTESGRKAQEYWATYRRRDRGVDASHRWNIAPGQSLCGRQSLNLNSIWDMSDSW